ncbi:YcdB/YcdC domain-containing protein [Solibacillus silvestris]|uniref:YcdB/YcdC domain-containing protein n=1 Tax=Solibacillus silvestris TaxID=76853 RepID=UPI003F806195
MKKWTTALSMSVVTLGLLANPAMTDASVMTKEERVPIYVAMNDEQVTKEQLIQVLKTKLPEMFSTYSNSDFQMTSMSFHYADDLTTRYELMFQKKVNKQTESGSVTFKGDNLEIENFYFVPANIKDALFPGKVSEEQARKVAEDFVKKVSASTNYILGNEVPSYYNSRLITEPITYTYSFTPTEKNIPISDQTIMVTVLGDGKIQYYTQMNTMQKRMSFEDATNIASKEAAVKKMKEQLNLTLQYSIDYEPASSKPTVKLVYLPDPNIIGLHATSNKWATYTGKVDALTGQTALRPLSTTQLKTPAPITVEEAKAIAKQLVERQSDTSKFTIDSAYEHDMNDHPIISISYSYHYKNATHSSSIEFNKKTGELISYSDYFGHFPASEEQAEAAAPQLAKEKVIAAAEEYVKQLAPTSVHEYATTQFEPTYDKDAKVHYVSFPRIKDGLIVNGDNLSVSIDDEGQLKSFYRYPVSIEEWPKRDSVISAEEAKKLFADALGVKLVYNTLQNEQGKYELVYIPTVNGQDFYQIDANSGKIYNGSAQTEGVKISHPTAEKELNYLIQAGAIDVKDSNAFNADVAITQGQALNTLIKSISYFYEDYYAYRQEQPSASFEQINSEHPYFKVVETATRLGILNPAEDELNIDQKVTNEQLAVWYIRVLGLEQAAKHSEIYQLTIKDAADVDPAKLGYVALSHVLGLQKSEQSMFLPKKEVTYAQLSKSIIELAYEIAEKRSSGTYYY